MHFCESIAKTVLRTVSRESGLNRRPPPYHGGALPTELSRHRTHGAYYESTLFLPFFQPHKSRKPLPVLPAFMRERRARSGIICSPSLTNFHDPASLCSHTAPAFEFLFELRSKLSLRKAKHADEACFANCARDGTRTRNLPRDRRML